MNWNSRLIVVLLIVGLIVSCSTRPPFQQVPPTIEFVADGLSPKWDELTRQIMPGRINKRANASIVAYRPTSPTRYKLSLRFHSANKEITGTSGIGVGSATSFGGSGIGVISGSSKNKFLYTLEAQVTLLDQLGNVVWSWSGYAEDKDADDSIEELADKIFRELRRSGFITP